MGGAAVGAAANGRPWGEPAPGVKREGINERPAKLGPGGGGGSERRGRWITNPAAPPVIAVKERPGMVAGRRPPLRSGGAREPQR